MQAVLSSMDDRGTSCFFFHKQEIISLSRCDRGWWTGVGWYSFTCHRWGNWRTSMARGCSAGRGWCWPWLFCACWRAPTARRWGSPAGGTPAATGPACTARRTRCTACCGPSRHCGVDDDPQCKHCFADFGGRHGFLAEADFFFFLTRYTAGASGGAAAGTVLGGGGGLPRFRGFFLTR
jgi:hypothetical protein